MSYIPTRTETVDFDSHKMDVCFKFMLSRLDESDPKGRTEEEDEPDEVKGYKFGLRFAQERCCCSRDEDDFFFCFHWWPPGVKGSKVPRVLVLLGQ